MVEEGGFREDLYYRLNVFPLHLPPLRERGEDILLLAQTFIERLCLKMGRHFNPLSECDKALLQNYHWPGNARELQNVIERAIIQSNGRTLLLGPAMPQGGPTTILTESQFQQLQKRNIERALSASGGAIFGSDGAAALLGLKPTTLASRIKKLGIQRGARGDEIS